MKILAFDISSSVTGWCVVEATSENVIKLIDFGEIELGSKLKKTSYPLEYVEVLHRKMDYLIKEFEPDKVVSEDVFKSRNVTTFRVLCRLKGIFEITVILNGYKNPETISTLVARKTIWPNKKFRKGEIGKAQICDLLEKEYGVALKTEGFDASDAVVVGLASMYLHFGKNVIVKKPIKRKSRPSKK